MNEKELIHDLFLKVAVLENYVKTSFGKHPEYDQIDRKRLVLKIEKIFTEYKDRFLLEEL